MTITVKSLLGLLLIFVSLFFRGLAYSFIGNTFLCLLILCDCVCFSVWGVLVASPCQQVMDLGGRHPVLLKNTVLPVTKTVRSLSVPCAGCMCPSFVAVLWLLQAHWWTGLASGPASFSAQLQRLRWLAGLASRKAGWEAWLRLLQVRLMGGGRPWCGCCQAWLWLLWVCQQVGLATPNLG